MRVSQVKACALDRAEEAREVGGILRQSALVRVAEEWSQRAPEPFYDHAPAWLSTWTEHAALLDSPSPQPDGEHFLTLPLLNDFRWFPLSPPSPQDRIAQAECELPIPHRF